MYKPVLDIEIGGFEFTRVVELEIDKTVKKIGNTASIKIPTSALLRHSGQNAGRVETAKQFKVGDAVVIGCGYEGISERQEFAGFVSAIRHEDPVTIECLDNAWLLERTYIKKDWPTITLKGCLNFILTQVNASADFPKGNNKLELDAVVPDVTLAPFYIHSNGREAIDKLCTNYGMDAYFEGNKLFVHLPYTRIKNSTFYNFSGSQSNMAEVSRLKYVTEEDKRIRIKAVRIMPDNTRHEVIAGDKDGSDERTLYSYTVSPDHLKSWAESEIKKFKFNGYEGTFKAFHIPATEPGQVAVIEDPQFNRVGRYFVDSVKVIGGMDGLFRMVTIGLKL